MILQVHHNIPIIILVAYYMGYMAAYSILILHL